MAFTTLINLIFLVNSDLYAMNTVFGQCNFSEILIKQ